MVSTNFHSYFQPKNFGHHLTDTTLLTPKKGSATSSVDTLAAGTMVPITAWGRCLGMVGRPHSCYLAGNAKHYLKE